jgi:hypothetical protein
VGSLSLGGTVSPRLQLGVGSFAYTRWLSDAEPSRGQLVATALMATARFHPAAPDGLAITVGAGLARRSGGLVAPTAMVGSGPGLMASLGWEIPLSRSTALAPLVMAMHLAAEGEGIGVLGFQLAIVRH